MLYQMEEGIEREQKGEEGIGGERREKGRRGTDLMRAAKGRTEEEGTGRDIVMYKVGIDQVFDWGQGEEEGVCSCEE